MSTLYELISNSEEERERQVEFFKTVNISLPGYYWADETDLQILVECLNVYQQTGINYFNRYEVFKNSINPELFMNVQKKLWIDFIRIKSIAFFVWG